MDKYVTVSKRSARSQDGGKQETSKQRPETRYQPYGTKGRFERQPGDWKEKRRMESLLAPLVKDGSKPSKKTLTKHLLSTLSDEANPITHSDIYQRTDHVTSMATGHQRSDGRKHQTEYLESRSSKLQEQLPERHPDATDVLRGVRVYIDGYISVTTDIEMKKLVVLAGGEVSYTASGATHVLTSQQLSGSKTHKLLTSKSKSKVHVVRPEWIFDCINAEKRLPERNYTVIKSSTPSVADYCGAGPSCKASSGPLED